MSSRKDSDEHYIIELCDQVLGLSASRQHKFEWLRGDFSQRLGRHALLPVDAYYESIGVVVEFAERQHSEPVKLFDSRDTISGVSRGLQRRLYDERRADLIPRHGIQLIVIPASAFELKRHRIVRRPDLDREVVRSYLAKNGGNQHGDR